MPQRHKQLHGGDFSNYTCPQRVTKLAQDKPREAKTGGKLLQKRKHGQIRNVSDFQWNYKSIKKLQTSWLLVFAVTDIKTAPPVAAGGTTRQAPEAWRTQINWEKKKTHEPFSYPWWKLIFGIVLVSQDVSCTWQDDEDPPPLLFLHRTHSCALINALQQCIRCECRLGRTPEAKGLVSLMWITRVAAHLGAASISSCSITNTSPQKRGSTNLRAIRKYHHQTFIFVCRLLSAETARHIHANVY